MIFQQMLQTSGAPREPAWLGDLVGVPSPSATVAFPSGNQDKDAFLPEKSSVKLRTFQKENCFDFTVHGAFPVPGHLVCVQGLILILVQH